MKPRRLFVFGLILAVLGGLIASPVEAWETATIDDPLDGWRSIYRTDGESVERALLTHHNEHPVLAEMALKELGAEKIFGFKARTMDAIDLNASVFRTWLRKKNKAPRQVNDAPLELRRIPSPPQFTGVPDYSYALHDWINKNAYCPAEIPSDDYFVKRCYLFKGWMGALNSNHFGSQATTFYQHLHELARSLAKHAGELRRKIEKDRLALGVYADFIREAEREAMAVEGYAQHFLQDRWSMGHMWERWNASDYGALTHKSLIDNLEISVAAGLLHGSESVAGMPDAMSSPFVSWAGRDPISKRLLPEKWTYILPTWRHFVSKTDLELLGPGVKTLNTEYPGAGDHRLADIIDRRFGAEYKKSIGRDFPYEMGEHRKQMMRCFMAGWAEVIRDFGKHPDGGYGVDRVNLKGGISGFDDPVFVTRGCFNAWATNRTMVLGWMDTATSLATLTRQVIGISQDAMTAGQIVLNAKDLVPGVKEFGTVKGIVQTAAKWTVETEVVKELAPDAVRETAEGAVKLAEDLDDTVKKTDTQFFKTNRLAWAKMYYRVWKARYSNKDATDLARGGLGSFGEVKHGGEHNSIAGYTEPKDLSYLPEKDDKTGKDKNAWYGLFNRAHGDYWCEQSDYLLEKFRRHDNKTAQAACRYLADRLYTGTNPRYTGKQRARRFAPNGKEVGSFCSFFDRKPNPKSWADQPVSMPPGYTSVRETRNRSTDDQTYKAVENWCARMPVLMMVDGPESNEDVVAIVKNPSKPVDIAGFDLGDDVGVFTLLGEKTAVEIKSHAIRNWADHSTSFSLPDAVLDWKDGDYIIKASLGGARKDVKTVGRFVLRLKRERPKVVAAKITRDWDQKVMFNDHPNEPKTSERIHPETYRIKVRFDVEMDEDSEPRVWIGGFNLPIRGGRWLSKTDWEASFILPDGDSFDAHMGNQALFISARADSGAWLDTDRQKRGFQPDQSRRLRFGRPPPAPPALDLTGCYGDEGISTDMELTANIGQVTGRSSFKPLDGPRVWFDVSGEYLPPNLTLRHKYTRATATAILPEIDQEMLDRLLASGGELTYRLKVYASKTPEGELEPATLGGDIETYPEVLFQTLVREYEAGRQSGVIKLAPAPQPYLTLQLFRRDGRAYEMTDLKVTDKSGAGVAEIGWDQPFWVTVQARDGCPVLKEKLYLRMAPKGEPNNARWITLVESEKNSRIFQSPDSGFQIPWNIAAGEVREIGIYSEFHAGLKPANLKVVGSDQAWPRKTPVATEPLNLGAQPLNLPGSPMSLVDDGSGRPRAITPIPGAAPTAAANPTASFVDTQNQAAMDSYRAQLNNLRQNIQAVRQQANLATGEVRAALLDQAAQMEKAAEAFEAKINRAQKQVDEFSKNAMRTPELNKSEWRSKLSKSISDLEAALAGARSQLASEADSERRQRIERRMRDMEGAIERLKEQLAALNAPAKSPPAPKSTPQHLTESYREKFTRMKQNVEDGWSKVRDLEAKAKAASGEQRLSYQTRADQWREQTEAIEKGLPDYLESAKETFRQMGQPVPDWMTKELKSLQSANK